MENFQKKVQKKPSLLELPHRTILASIASASFMVCPIIIGISPVLAQKNEANTLSYSKLIEKTQQGQVKKVEIDEVEQIARVYLVGKKPEDPPMKVKLLAQNPELINILKKQNVEFGEVSSAGNRAAQVFLFNLMWVLLLVSLALLLIRRSANASNQAMNFGKSRAKFQMEAKTGVKFDDVAGVKEAKEELEEVVTFLKQPEKFTAVGARIPKGVLLVGPPGTGKTLLAKAIAGEAGVPFFSMSGSEFVEMFVGVGASRVRDLFKKAKENAPCLIFIDEIDAVGRQRGVGIGGGNDEREQTLNQLLTEMDGFEGNTGIIIIAATNRPDVLDSALLRPGRFDRQVIVDVPDLKGRLDILTVHAQNKKIDPSVSLEAIARRTAGFTGADLANLLNEAAILTARRRKEAISDLEINDATDRVVAGMEGTPLLDSKKKRIIAYHEVGKALVGTLIEKHDPVQKVTLIPRGQSLGLTWFAPNDEHFLMSRLQLLAIITAILAGRATEEVVFGPKEITSGGGKPEGREIEYVTSIARDMVTMYGMSDIGQFSLESGNQETFMRRNGMSKTDYSEVISAQIDHAIREIIMQCYQTGKNLITKNRKLVDHLVEILIEEETIDGDKFREIVAQNCTIAQEKLTINLVRS